MPLSEKFGRSPSTIGVELSCPLPLSYHYRMYTILLTNDSLNLNLKNIILLLLCVVLVLNDNEQPQIKSADL